MRPRTLVILLLVVVGLLAFIWYYERDLPSSEERAEQAKLLFRFDQEEVVKLEIEQGEKRVVLERQVPEVAEGEGEEASETGREQWRLTQPLTARADSALVDGLLGALTSMEQERALTDMTPAEAGLEEPRARMRMYLEAEVEELVIGSEVPASSNMIVGVEGKDGFFVVADGIWSQLDREPGEWRDRQVFVGQRADIERISLSRADQRVLLARRGDDFWLESPLVDRADETKISSLIGDLTSLRVESFVDEPEQTEGGSTFEPRAVLEVVLEGRAEPFRLELGEAVADSEGRFLARVEDQVVELDTRLPEVIGHSASEWLSPSWARLQTFEIDEVVMTDAKGETRLARAGANWVRGEEEIPFTTASDLLYAITEAEAERILEPAETESLDIDWEDPVLELRLVGDEESEPDELSLFMDQEGEYLARSADRESVLVLPANAVEEIRSKIADARSVEAELEETGPGAGDGRG